MNDFNKILTTLFDKFDDSPMGNIIIFYTGLCFIALIVYLLFIIHFSTTDLLLDLN